MGLFDLFLGRQQYPHMDENQGQMMNSLVLSGLANAIGSTFDPTVVGGFRPGNLSSGIQQLIQQMFALQENARQEALEKERYETELGFKERQESRAKQRFPLELQYLEQNIEHREAEEGRKSELFPVEKESLEQGIEHRDAAEGRAAEKHPVDLRVLKRQAASPNIRSGTDSAGVPYNIVYSDDGQIQGIYVADVPENFTKRDPTTSGTPWNVLGVTGNSYLSKLTSAQNRILQDNRREVEDWEQNTKDLRERLASVEESLAQEGLSTGMKESLNQTKAIYEKTLAEFGERPRPLSDEEALMLAKQRVDQAIGTIIDQDSQEPKISKTDLPEGFPEEVWNKLTDQKKAKVSEIWESLSQEQREELLAGKEITYSANS